MRHVRLEMIGHMSSRVATFVIALSVFAADRWSKWMIETRLDPDSVKAEYRNGMLRLTDRGVLLSNEVFQEFLTAC